MPTVSGAWAPSSSANARMRLVIEYTSTTSASTVSGSGDVYVEAGYSFNDSDNTFQASGTLISAWSGSKSLNVATGGRQKIHSFTFSHARGSSTASKSMAFALSGVNYVGATASVSASVSIPAVPKPVQPTGVKITRVSLTRVRITWSGGAVQQVQVARRLTAGATSGDWESYAYIGSGDRSSGVEYDVATGYEWVARVARVDQGVWSDWGYYSTGSALLFDAPPAPTGATTTYQSDSKRTTSWAFADSASNRATGMEISGWTQARNTWGAASALAVSARSHVDTSKIVNDRTRYRVRAVNAAGASAWVYGPYVSTTPAAPTGVAASRSGSSNIVVSLTNKALSDAAKIDLLGSSSVDGVAWSSAAAISGHTGLASGAVGSTISRTIAGLDPAKRWRFYGRASVAEPTALSATSSVSNTILLLQKPAAPKATAPVTTQTAGKVVTFQFAHQSLDGSGQTAAEVRYRIDGGAWTTRSVTGSASSMASWAALPAGMLEWQAHTRGAHADWSDWSGVVSLLVAEPPALEITSPTGGEWQSNRLTVTAAFGDASGAAITRYRLILRDGSGTVIEDKTVAVTGSPSTIKVTFTAVLTDGVTYQAELIATSGTGLMSEPAVVSVPVAFLLPGLPIVTADWMPESATVTLQVANQEGGPGVAATTSNRVERSGDAGMTWETVADGLAVDATTEDPLPPFRPGLLFRAVAISELGAETASDPVELDTPCGDLWLTGEDGAACRIELDLALQVSYGHTRVIEDYYGQPLPEAHYGEGRPVQWQISGALLKGQGLEQDWRTLLGQDCYLREPGGDAMWVSLQAISHSSQWVAERSIQLTADAVVHV